MKQGDTVTWTTSRGSFTGTVKIVHVDGLVTVECNGAVFAVSRQRLSPVGEG